MARAEGGEGLRGGVLRRAQFVPQYEQTTGHQVYPEPAEPAKRPAAKKNTKDWCRGHVGRLHTWVWLALGRRWWRNDNTRTEKCSNPGCGKFRRTCRGCWCDTNEHGWELIAKHQRGEWRHWNKDEYVKHRKCRCGFHPKHFRALGVIERRPEWAKTRRSWWW